MGGIKAPGCPGLGECPPPHRPLPPTSSFPSCVHHTGHHWHLSQSQELLEGTETPGSAQLSTQVLKMKGQGHL